MNNNLELFNKLTSINVNEHTEKKPSGNGKELTYLTWCWAWSEFKKVYPEAVYEVVKFDNLPYVFDSKTGYMVYTKVTAGDLTYEMWLPVMDSNNKAMKDEPYKYSTRYGEKNVDKATMFDINKTIMRCLVKNLAMFGLGLYIYAGEDLPECEQKENASQVQSQPQQPKVQPQAVEQKKEEQPNVDFHPVTPETKKELDELKIDEKRLCLFFHVKVLTEELARKGIEIKRGC